MTKLTLIPPQSGLLEVLLKHQRRRVIQLSRPPAQFLFAYVRRVAVIVAALSFLFVGVWFGVSTHRAPRPSYPYYDTHKTVPSWSEPVPLRGNHARGGEYK